ncbi:MAG: chemotaxis protein CheX [Candidatus Auribacterota bacterium]|uniref:Chemotaxis protein CheX n=1 Tax=Candidatus Auribacter fodinae TaxID=2093366 RepID=A0A3A4QTS4_9BACT|nr:MAG: chemotaxis protein CheX [Candidatus Auribacter fodinae]
MSTMKVEYINPFINATLNALSTMASTSPAIGKVYLKGTEKMRCEISGTIGVAGDATGSVTINFPREVVLRVVSNMLGMDVDDINDDVKDAVGEIANMIAGGAKGELTQMGFNFKIALPVVCVGKNHYTNYPKDVVCVVIPFSMDEGDFSVEVALKMGASN